MKKNILFSLYLIPVVILIGFVAHFSINVPIDDEWRLAPFFEKIAQGNITFNDFWALHSNHRIVFPKIIISLLGFASRWNINYQLCLSIGLAGLTFIATYKLSSLQAKNGDNLWHLANILTCILVFSLVQYENWLWGFQLAWFLVNLCFVSAVNVLVSDNKFSPKIRISLAAIFCFIASFSLAQGLLSWLVAIPAVMALEGKRVHKKIGLIVWMLLFVATCAVYSIDYHPTRKTSIISLLNKPLVVIDYFLSLLGSPIVRSPGFSALVGLVIFASFIFFVWHFGRKITEQREALPWLSIGWFSVLSSLFITAGRAEFGAVQAIESSRYTTNSILLLIALVQLGQLFVRGNIATINGNYKFIYRGVAGLLVAIIIVNSQQAIAQTSSALLYKQGAQNCLQLINYLEPSEFFKNSPESCLRVLSKKTWLVREGAAILDRIGWRKFAKNVEFISNPEKVYGYLDKPPTGEKSFKAAGWAVLPENLQQPKIVLLSVGDKQSFFANAYVNLDSPDIAKILQSQLYNNARWAVDLSDRDLSIAQTEIKAWVYNPVDNQFVQLRGG
ncbi:hypothetical protein IQ269_09170 [Tychonema sp. LEGE 07199]|uniref:hypothetical protein n=1 Tax=unclassified Tychonema TaxID=2642144 RepID=UPI00187F5D9A|nr:MULTISPECIES: hypothetical protein [unclassified Tychonema]MBE9120985.1 hypothetical protein [Tychonema sp. LEGE 07199]MBE9131114.1 hypothetical protein [Tychonema sp. LEGE 07196]